VERSLTFACQMHVSLPRLLVRCMFPFLTSAVGSMVSPHSIDHTQVSSNALNKMINVLMHKETSMKATLADKRLVIGTICSLDRAWSLACSLPRQPP
jgi:hypothetical protein